MKVRRHRSLAFVLSLWQGLTLSISGCGVVVGQGARASQQPPAFTLESYPNVGGSTSTLPLQSLVACHLLGVECAWSPSRESASSVVAVVTPRTDGSEFEHFARAAAVNALGQSGGTHDAYRSLIGRERDLILVARKPSPDEVQLARGKNLILDARPIALDAMVLLVNVSNPVGNLSKRQLRDVFTGAITDWGELGGRRGEIRPYQRKLSSGSQASIQSNILQGQKTLPVDDYLLLGTMAAAIERVAMEPGAISYSVYYYAARIMRRAEIKMLAVDGVEPNSQSIGDRTYSFATEVFAVTRQDLDPVSPVVRLRDWLLSAPGQEVVARSGYAPMPTPEAP